MFDPELSDTYEQGIDHSSITFGSGKLEGIFGRDKIELGESGISIEAQSIGLTTNAKVFDETFDCIVGLAYPQMAAKFRQSGEEHVPFFDSIMDQGLLTRNLYAFSY